MTPTTPPPDRPVCPRLADLAREATAAAHRDPGRLLSTIPRPYPGPGDELHRHAWRLPTTIRVDQLAAVARAAIRHWNDPGPPPEVVALS